MTRLQDFSATAIDGHDVDLSTYEGQVLLVVNSASQCGFTVLGFPCDQFGNQEPGDETEIADFCERNFGVTFPLFSKIEVNGDDAHPLYQWLREQKSGVFGNTIKWNFTKYLVGRDGQVVDRYAPTTKPEKLTDDIEKALAD
jgi:glutathione peroxidase